MRHQDGGSIERNGGGDSSDRCEAVDRQDVPGATGVVAPENLPHNPGHATNFRTRLSLDEVQAVKNMYSVCIPCWVEGLSCDQAAPCRECKARNKKCAYALCPVPVCHLNVKCPAFHILPGCADSLSDEYKVGTALHLIALLGLDREFVQSYDVRGIQEMHNHASSAQSVYVLMREEIQNAAQREKRFNDYAIRKLLKDSDDIPKMGKRALNTTASMVAKLLEQQA